MPIVHADGHSFGMVTLRDDFGKYCREKQTGNCLRAAADKYGYPDLCLTNVWHKLTHWPGEILTTEPTAAIPKGHLLRSIGFIGMAVLVLNSVIGAGIFALPSAIASAAGAWSPWLFLIVGVLVITVVLSFAELASYFSDSGGPVLYTTTAYGPLVGFGTGWILYLSRMTAFAANVNVMAIYLGAVWPWFIDGIGRGLVITLVCVGLTVANYLGVKDGVRTMAVFTFFKLTPIFILILLGLPYVTPDTLLPAGLPEINDIGGTTLLLIYAYVGFESATIISGETLNPRRTLPRALVATVIATGAIYFLIVLVYISVLPNFGADSKTLTDVGRELAGPAGVIVITLAAVFSIGGNLSSIMLAVPRLTFAMSEQHLLPGWFGEVHQKYSTPGNSIILLGGLGLVFALSGSFAFLAATSSLTRLITYMLCIIALPIIRRRADAEARAAAYRLKGGYTIPLIALGVCAWIAAQSNLQSWSLTAGLLVVGFGLYLAARQREA